MANDTQSKITVLISRVYKEFGSQITFGDRNSSSVKDGYVECPSYPDKRTTIKLKERDAGIQVVPFITEKSTQTRWTYPRNACTQYEPREFSEKEKQEGLSSKRLKDFVNSVSLRLELALQQNEIMNAFFDDWKALSGEESTLGGKPDSHLKEFQTFTDLSFSKGKTISCINWHPTIPGLIAVSVTERLSFEDRLNESSKLVLKPSMIIFWSFNDPIHPQLLLECPDDVYCFEFCPSNPNIIAGGCINGQVVLWDISAHEEKLTMKKPGVNPTPAPKTGLETKAPKGPQFVRFCAVSSIEHGHRNVITDIHWLPDFLELSRAGIPYENKNGCSVQLVTCSPDCNVMFWDIRLLKPSTQTATERKITGEKPLENPNAIPETFKHLDLTWKPFIKATIPKNETNGEFSPLKISMREEHYHTKTLDKLPTQSTEEKTEAVVDYTNLRLISAKNPTPLEDFSTKYFAGTEDGELIYTDWKIEKDGDTGRFLSSKPSAIYVIHGGFVHTVQRSPFFKDIILTVGGWNLAIWKEGVTSGPILQSFCCQKRYTTAHWSLSRPGVFFIGKEDGNIDIWDLLEKTHEPAQTQNISSMMITYIKPCIASPKQHFLAATDHNGTLHILEMPWTLRHPSVHEISSVQHYFEREVKHLEYFDQRKIFRTAQKRDFDLKEINKQTETAPPAPPSEPTEVEIVKQYDNYLQLEKIILAELSINKVPEAGPKAEENVGVQ
ncbi:dynein axonemal intermediate chain 3 [Discoglossus pictus]